MSALEAFPTNTEYQDVDQSEVPITPVEHPDDNQIIEEGISCLIIDGMAFVQEMCKPQRVKTCCDLAKHFCQNFKFKAQLHEVHVVFDHYNLTISLKEAIQIRRTGTSKVASNNVSNSIPFAKVTMKLFLST